MTASVFTAADPLPITQQLQDLLQQAIQDVTPSADARFITLNYRDPTYTAESGGYHPVEIRIDLTTGKIECISGFAYDSGRIRIRRTGQGTGLRFRQQLRPANGILLSHCPSRRAVSVMGSEFLSVP